MREKARELQVKQVTEKRAKPRKSTTAIMTRRAGSSHSRLRGSPSAASTTTAHCSLVQLFGLIVSISPELAKLLTFIDAPRSPLHFSIRRVYLSIATSLVKWSLNAVALSISISGVGLSSPLSLGYPSRSTGISDLKLIVGRLPPMAGSHMFELLSSQPSYHSTMIADLRASPWQLGLLNEVNQPVAQLISGLWVLNHANSSTRSYALSGMTSTSGLWRGAKWSIYWSVIAVLWIFLACAIRWQCRLWVVMYTASWDSPSLLTGCGAMKMLVALQSMSTRIRSNSPCWSRIWTSWIMYN